MKKIILKIGILAILTILIIPNLSITKAFAQSKDYVPLAPLPGTLTMGTGETNLQTYLPGIFKLAVGLATVFAVLMIVIGGFQYMSTDAIQGKSAGKERIKNAVFGLVLVIGAWLILYTINPNLLTLNLNITSATVAAPAGTSLGNTVSTPGVAMTTDQIIQSNAERTSLATEGILTYASPCASGQTTSCVNLNGLTEITKDGLVLIKKALTESGCTSCQMIITAGTESSVHAKTGDHPAGKAVDLKPDPALSTALGFPSPRDGDTKTKVFKIDGKPDITVTFTYEVLGGNAGGTSTGNHWHVSFK
jgi:hypothetical protein